MNKVFLLTGGNLGDRQSNIYNAAEQIVAEAGVIVKQSALYETAPWGFEEQQPFLNQALEVETTLSADILLRKLLAIENKLGRQRIQKLGPRIIDIDILFYNEEIITTPDLKVPHPELANRRFVLTPLAEIAENFIHPISKNTIGELLAICPDKLSVVKLH